MVLKYKQKENETIKSFKILIVEDDEALVYLIQKNLQKAGYTTEVASSGNEAISWIVNNPNSLVILDYILPDMEGMEVIEKLAEKGCSVPFIIITGYNDLNTALEMMKLGAQDYLIKDPNFIDLLLPAINRVNEKLKLEEKVKQSQDSLEKQIREAQFLSNLLNESFLPFAIGSKDGKLIKINHAFSKLTGYPKEELINDVSWSKTLTPPEYWDYEAEILQTLLSTGIPQHFEKEYIRKDGTRIDVELHVGIKVDVKGNLEYIYGFVNDITERKKAEGEIKRKTRVLDAINKIFYEALACETEEELGKKFLSVAEELTDSKFGFFGELNEDGFFNSFAISTLGWAKCKMATKDARKYLGSMPIRGVDRATIKDGKSRIVNGREAILNHHDHVKTPKGHPPVTAFLGVPLKHQEKIIGMIGLGNKEGGYNLDDQEAVESLSMAMVEALKSKRAKEDLKESEEKWRSLTQNSPDIIILLDHDWNIKFVNYTVPDLTPEEVIGTHISNYIPDKFWPNAEKCYKKVWKTSKPGRYEMEYYAKDDSFTVYFEARVGPMIQDGKVGALIINASDITERKKAEEKLKESEEKHRLLLENMGTGAAYYDTKGKLILINKKGAQNIGGKPADFIGKRVHDIFKKEVADLIWGRIERTVNNNIESSFEDTMTLPSGTKTIITNYNPILDVKKRVIGVQIVAFDITDRKKAEEEMKRRLMKFKLEDGSLYLVKEPIPTLSIGAFNDLIKVGYKGVVISRTPKEKFKTTFDDNVRFLWISERGGKHSMSPDLKKIEHWIEKLSKNNAILLDRLDYLIFKNGFENTLSFVQRLRELAFLENNVIIFSIDPSTLDKKDLRLLEKEGEKVEYLHKVKLPEDLLETLKFIYKENARGIKPSHTNVKREMRISKPTVNKRIKKLVADGYVIDIVKGRYKVLEITERGRRLFLE